MNSDEYEEDLLSGKADEDVALGLPGMMAASQKVLAINRGLEDEDRRDSQSFKRVLEPSDLLAERIKLDRDNQIKKLMRTVARTRNLAPAHAGFLSPTAEAHITKNPLTIPLEQINPLDESNQHHRISLMGDGGISSAEQITGAMQAVDVDQFGFISPLEGPECFDAATQVYTTRGWVGWPELLDSDELACRVGGTLEWHKPIRLVKSPYNGFMIVGETSTLRMCVTPNHRVWCSRDKHYKMELADEVYGKTIRIGIQHGAEAGDESLTHVHLPQVTTSRSRGLPPLDILDWAEFIGWWLSEGNHTGRSANACRSIRVHQCAQANPVKHARLRSLLLRLRFITPRAGPAQSSYTMNQPQLRVYFDRWRSGCYDKWIPEECFKWPVKARERLLEGLLLGDGRWNIKRMCYCTVSERLAFSVERLAVGLGYPAFVREEKDARPHVRTTNYVVSISRARSRTLTHVKSAHRAGKTYGGYWRQEAYAGYVYCATVPGGMLLVRGKPGTCGFWSGNSELAGVDVRMAHGVRIGSNGRLYQKFRNPRTGNWHWLSAEDLAGKIVALPET